MGKQIPKVDLNSNEKVVFIEVVGDFTLNSQKELPKLIALVNSATAYPQTQLVQLENRSTRKQDLAHPGLCNRNIQFLNRSLLTPFLSDDSTQVQKAVDEFVGIHLDPITREVEAGFAQLRTEQLSLRKKVEELEADNQQQRRELRYKKEQSKNTQERIQRLEKSLLPLTKPLQLAIGGFKEPKQTQSRLNTKIDASTPLNFRFPRKREDILNPLSNGSNRLETIQENIDGDNLLAHDRQILKSSRITTYIKNEERSHALHLLTMVIIAALIAYTFPLTTALTCLAIYAGIQLSTRVSSHHLKYA
jgi:hypothetical protein